ncbi:zonular occludens toxin family protein [Pseudoalteromonas maricaloris]|uniref:zonular occludens toxin family protein n=1 Tax=Pseudoalteromonas maricaloris TaxID=184924 RepID=UPI0005802F52|nr:zonular occludens toxin domain-containing protein [Pseudoalteromonas flavipulchra]KID34837.1 zona occludens toxin-like protein [Pseudoalteromonas flavipulchra NCIMB 2033 = ATCC BAA-314]MBD0784059.1 zona occludens toxin-like protein [Pseudoalteromonas flavipulchra]MBE0372886.1 zona occludens toxin [Pseudoalteromonas flavipulchra NCIMB 2033 = ATCC BAA-314]
MATSIFHGAPGSFKSASAVWFELLPALRAGRLVVTNIEGIKPIEDIEQELNETFPETAKLWRMSSQSDTGHKLWRNWYHWIPCGALIIMDEVQDIYPTETTQFKPESCDYQPVQNYQELLPEDWYQYHLDTLETYKPDNLTSGDVDDLGIEIFNEHGHIIYPKTLKEAYMRHRKYNWDIICCTPDITSVHKYIRNVSQYAYAHKYFDGLAKIPYFYRRPRIHEHNPKLDGKTPNKADPKKWRKIPVRVHDLYKSTATKSITSATGKNFLLSPMFAFPVVVVTLCIGYFFLYFSGTFDVEKNQETETASVEGAQTNYRTTGHHDTVSSTRTEPIHVGLPFNAKKAQISAILTTVDGSDVDYYAVIEFDTGDDVLSLNTRDMKQMGFHVVVYNQCFAKISFEDFEYNAFCKPTIPTPPSNEREQKPINLAGFGGAAPSEA